MMEAESGRLGIIMTLQSAVVKAAFELLQF